MPELHRQDRRRGGRRGLVGQRLHHGLDGIDFCPDTNAECHRHCYRNRDNWGQTECSQRRAIAPAQFPDQGRLPAGAWQQSGQLAARIRDAFVAMFNTNASGDDSLVYSSFLGGSRQDEGEAIGLDAGGNPVVGGWTRSDCPCCDQGQEPCFGPSIATGFNDFPTTAGAFQEEPSTADDGWVVSFAGGSSVIGQGQGFMISGQVTTRMATRSKA